MTTYDYEDINIEVEINTVFNGNKLKVVLPQSEGWMNIALRTSLTAHLLHWGYNQDSITPEFTGDEGLNDFRADIYAVGSDTLPTFWFECNVAGEEKLDVLRQRAGNIRVVHVVDSDRFETLWNRVYFNEEGEDIANPSLTQLKEQRRKYVPQQTELWGVDTRRPGSLICFAVRQESDGEFTYLDSGEGCSIREFKGFSRRYTRIGALIPQISGSDVWTGRSRRTERT